MKKPELDMQSKRMMVNTKTYSKMIDVLIESERVLSEYYATDHEGSFDTRSILDQIRDIIKECIRES